MFRLWIVASAIVSRVSGRGKIMSIRGNITSRIAVVAAIGFGAGLGLSGFGAGAASAHEPDQRLPPITLEIGATKAPAILIPTAASHLLSDRDRFTLTDGRTKATRFAVGPMALTVSGSRLRTRSQKGQQSLRSPDRISVFAGGLDAGVDVLEGVTLHAFTTLMRAKRRIDLLPGASRSLNSSVTAFGMAIEQSALGSLVLDYTSNAARGRHDALSRMTGQVGGAMPFGKGMRLSLSNATAADARGRLTWTMSAASVRRPTYLGDFSASMPSVADRRAEVAFRIAL